MTKKVMITQGQADAIEFVLDGVWSQEDIIKFHARGHKWSSPLAKSLNEMPLLTLVDALRVGCEIKPEFEVGDWVKDNCVGEICKVTRIEGGEVWGYWGGCNVEQWGSMRMITHATDEEIRKEKERRLWKSIEREPGEIKQGDIGENNTGTLIFSKSEIEFAYKHGALKSLFPIEKFVCFWGDGDE